MDLNKDTAASLKFYVLDTNILIDYPDIIPNGDSRQLLEPSIDLTGAHLVIPTAVIRELSNHKKEMSDRGYACRTVLKRIRKLVEKSNHCLDEVYQLDAPISIREETQTIHILPVSSTFRDTIVFNPSDEDMDGQIILATIVVQRILADIPITRPEFENQLTYLSEEMLEKLKNLNFGSIRKQVTLLTNDNGLAIRAYARGVRTGRFSYKLPAPYTGRRDLTVPPEMFKDFFLSGELSREDFERFMPNEPPLIANEYLIMYPESDLYPDSFDQNLDGAKYFHNIGRYDLEDDKILPLSCISAFPTEVKNPGQAIYADALLNRHISAVICTGPAGSGKTYMATIYAYKACENHDFIGAAVVPCQVQDDNVGYLPGDLDEKLDPAVQPIKNAIRNYLLHEDKDIRRELRKFEKFTDDPKESKKSRNPDNCDSDFCEKPQKSLRNRLENQSELIWENWFGDPIPIAYARGRDFTKQIAFYDEFQDQNRSQADTLLKRIGEDGKIIITGDIEQIHAAYLDKANNGLTYARNLLRGNPYVAQVTFLPGEVIRHPLVRAIVEKQSK